jgi:hypothetical protein
MLSLKKNRVISKEEFNKEHAVSIIAANLFTLAGQTIKQSILIP